MQQPVSLIFAATAVAGGRSPAASAAAATVLLSRTVAVVHPDEAPAALRVLRLPEDIYHTISMRRGILDVYAATPATLAYASEPTADPADTVNTLDDLPDYIRLESSQTEPPVAASTGATGQFPWSMLSLCDENVTCESDSEGPPGKRRRGSYGEEFRLFCSELPRYGSELPGYSSASGSGGGGGTCFDLMPPLSVSLSGSPSSLESGYTLEGGTAARGDHMHGGGTGGGGGACMAGVRGFVKRQLTEQDPERRVYTRLYNGHSHGGAPSAAQSSYVQRPAEADAAALWRGGSLDDGANVHVGLTSLLCEQMLTDLDGADPCGGWLESGL